MQVQEDSRLHYAGQGKTTYLNLIIRTSKLPCCRAKLVPDPKEANGTPMSDRFPVDEVQPSTAIKARRSTHGFLQRCGRLLRKLSSASEMAFQALFSLQHAAPSTSQSLTLYGVFEADASHYSWRLSTHNAASFLKMASRRMSLRKVHALSSESSQL